MVRVSPVFSSSQSSSSSSDPHHVSQQLGGLAIDEHMPRPPAPETLASHGNLAHTQSPPPPPPHRLGHPRSHRVSFHEPMLHDPMPCPPARETPAPHGDPAYGHYPPPPPPHSLGHHQSHHVGFHESMPPYPTAHEQSSRHLFRSRNHFPPLAPPSFGHHHSPPPCHGHPHPFGGAGVHDPMRFPHAALESVSYHNLMNCNQYPPPPPHLDYHSFQSSPNRCGGRHGFLGHQFGRFTALEGGEPHALMDNFLPVPSHLRYCGCLDPPSSAPYGHLHGDGYHHPHHLGRRPPPRETVMQFIDHLDGCVSPPPPPPPPYGHHVYSSCLDHSQDGSVSPPPPPPPPYGHHMHSSYLNYSATPRPPPSPHDTHTSRLNGSLSPPPPPPPPHSHHVHSSHLIGSVSPPPPPPPPPPHHIHSSDLEWSLYPPPPPPHDHHSRSLHLDETLSPPPPPPPPPHQIHFSYLHGSFSPLPPPPPPYTHHIHSSHVGENSPPPPPPPPPHHIHSSPLEDSLSPLPPPPPPPPHTHRTHITHLDGSFSPPPPPPPPNGHHVHSSPLHSFQHHAAKGHVRTPMEHSQAMLDDYERLMSGIDLHLPHHYTSHPEHVSNLPREEEYPRTPHQEVNDGYDDYCDIHGGHNYAPHDMNRAYYPHLLGGAAYPRHPPHLSTSRNRGRSPLRPSYPRFCGAFAPATYFPNAHLAVPVW